MPSDIPTRPTLSLVPRDASAAFYVARAKEVGGPALVLGSATGHIACELAQAGFQVTGVEPSEVLMSQAAAAKTTRPAEVAARVTWIQADLRSLRLESPFPLVLAPQNAFGALGSADDLDDLLATVAAHLGPGGAFVFDVAVPPAVPSVHHAEADGRPVPVPPAPRAHFIPHLRERKRTTEKTDAAGLHRLRLRQFTPAELDEALGRAGLQAMERYGNFEGRPYDSGDAMMVVVAGEV